MTKKLLFVATLALVFSFAALAADVSGKWVGEVQGRNGAQPITITLKADGAKLTGTVLGGGGGRGAGGGGGAPMPREISDGKIDGNSVSFAVKFEGGGGPMITKYTGTLDGDSLKVKQTRETPNGTREAEFTAKRSTT